MANRRSYGEGSIYKDSNSVWHAKVCIGHYQNGKRKFKEFKSKDKRTVMQKKKEFELSLLNDGSAAGRASDSLEDFMIRWFVNVKQNQIKPSSYTRAINTFDSYIKPLIGFYNISDLTSDIIQTELINCMRDKPNCITGKPNSFSSINKAYVYLHACLEYAVDEGKIRRNPCRNVTLPKSRILDAKDKRFFNDEEIKKFVEVCDLPEKTGSLGRSKYNWVYKFILYTGIRAGEMLALRKECIDIKNKRILICRTIISDKVMCEDGKQHIRFSCQETTKNGKSRFVPLSQSAINAIMPAYNKSEDGDYVINNSKSIFNVPYLSNQYAKVCKKANICNPQGVHTLRHTFASKLFRSGVDVKTVSEILGHASVAFTYKTYIHLVEQTKADAVAVWDKQNKRDQSKI